MLPRVHRPHLVLRLSRLSGRALVLLAPVALAACDPQLDAFESESGSETLDDGADDPDAPDAPDAPDDLDDLPSPSLPGALLDYGHNLPAHFQIPLVSGADNTPGQNPITNAGATLGRVLFWDRRLSQNGAVACGSCHEPSLGFADDRDLSVGFAGDETGRNSMSLINLRYYDRGAMFWDERAATLEDQVLMPIQDGAEMGMTLDELVARVGETDYYAPLFTDAFGDAEVNEERIALALAQFVRSIASYSSAWDEGVALAGAQLNQDFPNFSAEQNLGKDLFFGRARCGTCHMPLNPLTPPPPGPGGQAPPSDNLALMFVNEPVNNGLLGDDEGYGAVTGLPQDRGAFKSPSLRNVELTAPYMHDGRFASLEEVVDHYDRGIADHPNLDPRLRNPQTGQPIRLGLNPQERAALVAFMETFSDPSLATDPRWSDPF